MNKRVLSLLMVVAILAAVLGCSAFAEGAAEDLGTIVVTTAGSGEPYSLLHDDGSWTGIDSEMWAEIAERTGWEIELKQAAFDAICL